MMHLRPGLTGFGLSGVRAALRSLPFAAALVAASLMPGQGIAQVSAERLLDADGEPANWLTYSGTYKSQRYTGLDEITRGNVEDLELEWVFQAQSLEAFEATPVVVEGFMYMLV